MAPPKVKVTTRIPSPLHQAFQEAAARKCLNQTQAVEQAIRQWLRWKALEKPKDGPKPMDG